MEVGIGELFGHQGSRFFEKNNIQSSDVIYYEGLDFDATY